MSYQPRKIEKKWQKVWEKEESFQFSESKDALERKYYVLDMFPYPSGDGLHVGHPEGYTATDIIARFQRMRGFNVLHPMGWDAFGLPAENYAIKEGVHPTKTTKKNIDTFRRQIKDLGFSYDWSREISTADPRYYRWTQWLFLYLYERDLAYQKEAPVNWCPGCQTVLANEQVVQGECERCGTAVEQKMLKQWFLKITDYAEELLKDLDTVDWPEKIKTMQRNWIGRSEGAELEFKLKAKSQKLKASIKTFTTRPDTLFGATYMVLAPENELVKKLEDSIKNQEEVEKYIRKALQKTELERKSEDREKTGVKLEGVTAINPANSEEIPVFVADYVLASYGTGAIMAVPAHDDRDYHFAKKFNLPIKEVITPQTNAEQTQTERGKEGLPYEGEGELINSGKFNGMSSQKARDAITKKVGGTKKVQYRLRDWLISRQRYWGAPIPIIYCDECGTVPVPEENLPVELPEDVAFEPSGESPLEESESFHNITCPSCGGGARRESDTMDTFVDSAWYYLRYIDPENTKEVFDKDIVQEVMPVDLYVGGAEHAVLHLLYARFITKALADGGVLTVREPFIKLRNQGMILGPDGQRMSKSRGNVINPDDVLEEYGADTFRLYEMFMGPFEADKPWDTQNIMGVFRFLVRVWKLGQVLAEQKEEERIKESKDLRRQIHQTIAKVEDDITQFRFNTAISALMVLLKEIEEAESIPAFRTFLLLLHPFAPHLTAELWEQLELSNTDNNYIWEESWPEVMDEYLEKEEIELVVQVDGTLRDTITLPAGLTKDELESAAGGAKNVAKHLKGKEVKDVIVVPDRLVNFVTK